MPPATVAATAFTGLAGHVTAGDIQFSWAMPLFKVANAVFVRMGSRA